MTFILRLAAIAIVSAFVSLFPLEGSAAAQGCPAISGPRWAQNEIVYFTISSALQADSDAKAQIESAFAKWTTANGGNGSNVSFVPAPGPSGSHVGIDVSIGNAFNNPGSIAGTSQVTNAYGQQQTANIELNINNAGGTTLWDPTDRAGYLDFMLKEMLHEIGHSMGLDDAPVTNATNYPSASVMNRHSVPNDSAGHGTATNVTGCDDNQVNIAYVWNDLGDGYVDTVQEDHGTGGEGIEICDYHYFVSDVFYWNGSGWSYWYTSYEFLYMDNCHMFVPEGAPSTSALNRLINVTVQPFDRASGWRNMPARRVFVATS